MNKNLCKILIVLVFLNTLLVLKTNAHELSNTKEILKQLGLSLRKSVKSIQQHLILSVVKGTVTLSAKGDISGELKDVLAGNQNTVSKKKKIPVVGINTGDLINLKGTGSGQGYFFSIQAPGQLNEFAKKRKSFKVRRLPPASISYIAGSINSFAAFDSGTFRGSRDKNKGNLVGNFSQSVPGGKAKGRFKLNLSAASPKNPTPVIDKSEFDNSSSGGTTTSSSSGGVSDTMSSPTVEMIGLSSDTVIITISGSSVNTANALNVMLEFDNSNVASLSSSNPTFSGTGASQLLTSADPSTKTLTVVWDGTITSNIATVTAKLQAGTQTGSTNISVVKIEAAGGIDITNQVTVNIEPSTVTNSSSGSTDEDEDDSEVLPSSAIISVTNLPSGTNSFAVPVITDPSIVTFKAPSSDVSGAIVVAGVEGVGIVCGSSCPSSVSITLPFEAISSGISSVSVSTPVDMIGGSILPGASANIDTNSVSVP
ncbi:MAG: hypothetical protein HYZ79_04520 [Candidatus Melainabacteria bacterium]|nr:hypothetical protein [Candidatus Melainabacteria bacterium]